jgi:hypothetical protein
MLNSADAVMSRYDEYSRRQPVATQPSHPFDVREYGDALKQLAATIDRMNQLIGSSNNLLASPEWDRRIEQLNEAADGRVRAAAGQSQHLVDEVFRRVYLSLGLLLVVLVLYRLVAALLLHWLHGQASRGAAARGAAAPVAAPAADAVVAPPKPGAKVRMT